MGSKNIRKRKKGLLTASQREGRKTGAGASRRRSSKGFGRKGSPDLEILVACAPDGSFRGRYNPRRDVGLELGIRVQEAA